MKMEHKNIAELVNAAVAINGRIDFDDLQFRRILTIRPNGNIVVDMMNDSHTGYMAIKKGGTKRLIKICETIIANKESMLAASEAARAGFALR